MALSEVIEFRGSPDALVWKYPEENFNTTSQLIVDETHEALLVLNGNAADLFRGGKHTLTTANIPMLSKLINIPTGGKSAFPCKVYYVNKVHQMDIQWGTQSAIPLEDPLYEIFMHIMLRGSISVSVKDTRKFLLKLVGFRDSFDAKSLVQRFRGIIVSHVKDAVSKIMINGQLSYFMISANLFEISEVVAERISEAFDEYGVAVEFFNIEAIEAPEKDLQVVSAAKEARASRLIQGYTWQEERQMMIAEKFAANEGTMGTMGGAMGGAMGGIVMGNTISEVARNALSTERIPNQAPPARVSDADPGRTHSRVGAGASGPFDVKAFLGGSQPQRQMQTDPVHLQNSVQSTSTEPDTSAVQSAPAASAEDPVETLKKLKSMLDLGLIPQDIYNAKMTEILGRM